MVYHGPGNPQSPPVDGAAPKFGSKIRPPPTPAGMNFGPLTDSFYTAGPRTVEESYMYKWLEQYQLQQHFVKIRQKFRCDFVKICSYVKPFAHFNRLDYDCTDLVEDKLFDILAIDDEDKDAIARAILESLQAELAI